MGGGTRGRGGEGGGRSALFLHSEIGILSSAEELMGADDAMK